MTERKNWLLLGLALLFPLAYDVAEYLWYDTFLTTFLSILPATSTEYLLRNEYTLEVCITLMMSLFVIPLYLVIRKDRLRRGMHCIPLTKRRLLPITIMGIGLSGLATLVHVILEFFVGDTCLMKMSMESFEILFPVTPTLEGYLWSVASIVILGPIIEEFIFRGILFTILHKYMRMSYAILLTAVYFSLWHGNLVQLFYTLPIGIGLGIVYAYTRNIMFPILVHMVNNMLANLPPWWESDVTFMIIIVSIRLVMVIPCIILLMKAFQREKRAEVVINL